MQDKRAVLSKIVELAFRGKQTISFDEFKRDGRFISELVIYLCITYYIDILSADPEYALLNLVQYSEKRSQYLIK